MSAISKIFQPLVHLFYPHTCAGCGSDTLAQEETICLHCYNEMPYTNYESLPGNPVEKIFLGRVNIEKAFAIVYFHKGQLVQNLIHQLKYKGNKDMGIFLGKIMAKKMMASGIASGIDYLVPLPLSKKKESIRGFNQSELICKGISEITGIPVMARNVQRHLYTESQTKKHRQERWQNVEGSFEATKPESLQHKHILLVDDVLTTGATIEACCAALKEIPGIKISIGTFAIASD